MILSDQEVLNLYRDFTFLKVKIEKLRFEYEDILEENKWKKIDTAPLDGSFVDLWIVSNNKDSFRWTDAFYSEGRWLRKIHGTNYQTLLYYEIPIYWKPIPDSPNSRNISNE